MDDSGQEVDAGHGGEGFTMECQGGDELVVSDAQARLLLGVADYFRNVFRHGTAESSGRILRKHDWSLATAKHVVGYLTGEVTEFTLGDVEGIMKFLEALQQVLAAAALFYPVLPDVLGHVHVEPKCAIELLRILNHGNATKFSVNMRLGGAYWDFTLRHGVLLLPNNSNATLAFGCRKIKMSENQRKRMCLLLGSKETYQAFALMPLAKAIQKCTKAIHLLSVKIAETNAKAKFFSRFRPPDVETEAMSILVHLEYKERVPKWDAWQKNESKVIILDFSPPDMRGEKTSREENDSAGGYTPDAVKNVMDATGVRGSILQSRKKPKRRRTTKSSDNIKKWVFSGTSFLQLKSCLMMFANEHPSPNAAEEVKIRGRVFLRLTAPATDKMENLIAAVQEMEDDKLEVDFYHNCFNVAKSTEAMIQLLTAASADTDEGQKAHARSSATFTLVEKDRYQG